MEIIAHIITDFPTKFGVPRQSGLANTVGKIVFEKKYAMPEAVRGLEDYSHIWLLWDFSLTERGEFSPTVRPPRLGGNTRVGVFATRSPNRPNNIGLSSVRLEKIATEEGRPVLYVSGADLVSGTPIYDIKPYLPFTDCHPDAKGGFADEKLSYRLSVNCENELLSKIAEDKREALLEILSEDVRPSYQNDSERIYGFEFSGHEIKFMVDKTSLTVISIE